MKTLMTVLLAYAGAAGWLLWYKDRAERRLRSEMTLRFIRLHAGGVAADIVRDLD